MTLYQLCSRVCISEASYISYWDIDEFCVKFKQLRSLSVEEANQFADKEVKEIYTSVDNEIILGLAP